MRNEIELLQKKLRINKDLLDIYPRIPYQSNDQFVYELLKELDKARAHAVKHKNLSSANFPHIKSLEGYSFSGIQIPESIDIEEIKALAFITRKENLILYGNVGTGKTHLAIALGIQAINQGLRVQYFSLHELVNQLVDAKEKGSYSKFMGRLNKNDCLILDEWGYLPLHHEGARLIYEVVSQFYEQKSIILTTNLEFSHWKNFLFDEKLTLAILDRIIHYSHLVIFNRGSYRKEHSLMK